MKRLWKKLRPVLKPFVPKALLDLRTRLIISRQRQRFSSLGVRETFERIYAEKAWGEAAGEFDSGDGSGDAVTGSYVELVRDFIRERGVRSVVDLGCGDFRVGRRLLSPGLTYVGVDVVRPLVERNQREFGGNDVSFLARDMIEGPLPEAELGLLRQVLQHLSNDEIARVLENAKSYKYLIVTEHIPVGTGVEPNRDKPHGPDTRLYDRSGVFLEQPPFSLETKTLLEVPLAPGEVLRSMLVVRENTA